MGGKEKKKTTINDWMIRIAFAEAGEPDMGFEATGCEIERKTKLALDKIMVVRSERMSAQAEGEEAKISGAEEGPKEPRGESPHRTTQPLPALLSPWQVLALLSAWT